MPRQTFSLIATSILLPLLAFAAAADSQREELQRQLTALPPPGPGLETRVRRWVEGDQWLTRSRLTYDVYGNPIQLVDAVVVAVENPVDRAVILPRLVADERRIVELRAAFHEGLDRFGHGAGASRLITGSQSPHVAFEEDLAAAKNTEAALLFSSGFATALGVLHPENGGPYEEPVGFVGNGHGGQIVPLALKQGRFLNEFDLDERRKVAVIGVRVEKFLFRGDGAG